MEHDSPIGRPQPDSRFIQAGHDSPAVAHTMMSMMALGGVLRATVIHSSLIVLSGWLAGCVLSLLMPGIGVGRFAVAGVHRDSGMPVTALSPTSGIVAWYVGVSVVTVVLCVWMLSHSLLAPSMRPVMRLVSRGRLGEKPRKFLAFIVVDCVALSLGAGLLVAGLLRALLWHTLSWGVLGVGLVIIGCCAGSVALVGWLLDRRAMAGDDAVDVDLWLGLSVAQGCQVLELLYARQATSGLNDFYEALHLDPSQSLRDVSAADRAYVVQQWTVWAVNRDC